MSYGLESRHLRQIRNILQQSDSDIDWVGLFGSRATGQYQSRSDIDLVLYGAVRERDVDRLYTLFMESLLPYKVDIMAYNQVTYLPLKRHIDAVVKTLFTHKQLCEWTTA